MRSKRYPNQPPPLDTTPDQSPPLDADAQQSDSAPSPSVAPMESILEVLEVQQRKEWKTSVHWDYSEDEEALERDESDCEVSEPDDNLSIASAPTTMIDAFERMIEMARFG